MSGDAALVALLASEEALNCILVELTHAYESGGAPATGTIYLSNTAYATRPIDQPASVSYIDCITAAPSFSRQIDQRTLTGYGRLSVGQLELDNSDARLAFLLDVVVSGQPCSIYIGNESWERSQFRRILYVLADTVSAPSPTRLVITLRDPGVLLNARVAGGVIGGSTTNADRRKPLVIGPARNVEGVFSDLTNLRYWLRHAGISGMQPNHYSEVRDNGISLAGGSISGNDATVVFSAGADTITYTSHGFVNEDVVLVTTTGTVPSPLVAGTQYWVRDRSANDFKLASTRTGSAIDIAASSFTGTITIASRGYFDNGDGSIDLAHTPQGQITADCAANGSVTRLSAAIEELVLTHAGLPPSLYGGPDTYDSWWGTTDEVGVALVCYEPENVIELLDRLTDAGTAYWGFTIDGPLKFARIRPQYGSEVGQMTLTVTEDDVYQRDAIEVDRVEPLYDQYACVHQKNWTQQSNLAAGVSQDNAARYAGPGLVRRGTAPSGTAYSTNPALYYKTLTDSPEFDTLIAAGTDGASQTFADAWLVERKAHFAPNLNIVRVTTRLTAYGTDLGDTVTLQLGADGIGLPTAGRTGVLVGMDVDLTGGRVTLTVARQHPPDTTTAAHYG